jgi:glycine/D-amino acid oxidase-like deaminating enzyme
MTADSVFHPDFVPRPYWWEAWAPRADDAPADLPAKTSVAIVGGGYAGLNAALELARGGVESVVLEAQDFGFGASTRNGGAVSGGINLGKGLGAKRDAGQEAARARMVAALLADGSASFALIEDIIRRERIECCWVRSGRFTGAYTRRHYAELARKLDLLNEKADAQAEMLPKERQHEEIASDFYHGGMLVRRSGKLHPALYYKGLLDACRRHKPIRLCSRVSVDRIEGSRGRWRLATSRGELAADEVVIATNGYTGPATPRLRRRLIPVASHIIATEELPPDLAASLIPRGRTIADTPRVLTYYRMSPDGKRMVFGGRARFTPVTPKTSTPLLHRMMTDRFPQLAGYRVTHAWTGNVAFTFDFMPHMGEEEGMHYCLGCNGSGVAMMTFLGHRTARKILGGGNRVSAFEEIDFPAQPGYAGTPWFLPLVGGWYRLRDRVDRLLDG